MTLKLLKLTSLFIAIVLFSNCSSDDETTDSTPTGPTNGIIFNTSVYPITTAWINDENTTTNDPSDIGITLYNKTTAEINSGNSSGITSVYFDFSEVDLRVKTYTDILDYQISINGLLTNGNYVPGTVLLSVDDPDADPFAISSTVTINSITDTTVDLSFSFTRNDRQVLTGTYVGNYVDLN